MRARLFRVSIVQMKLLCSMAGFALLSAFNVPAQVSATVTLDQDQFLPSESVLAAVHVTNRSGQTLHLGADPNWLTFSIESTDGFIVLKNADPPVRGEFDLGSSEVATKYVDLEPYFALARSSHYNIVATVRIKEWGTEISSQPKGFDVIDGAKLWSQVFGVPVPAGVTNRAPEIRKYTLEEANYLRAQLQLYVQVSDESETHVLKVRPLCRMVSFGQPETQIDRLSNLHVLSQSGASAFTYFVINPDGDVVRQEIYDYVNTHPRLDTDENGDIVVAGGVRRNKVGELPAVKSLDQTQ
jgi:hypothetical protein